MHNSIIRLTLVALFVLCGAAHADLPSDYGAVPFEKALAQARTDGKPVMLYFGEDW